MSVFLAIPSAKSRDLCDHATAQWREMGYKIAIFRDEGAEAVDADVLVYGEYKSYGYAVNRLCEAVCRSHPDATWCVAGGDDVSPEPAIKADGIAAACERHFGGTLGVMEPTGDRFMEDEHGRCAAERVCIAPWLGREWIRRSHRGHGPMWEGVYHFFVDNALHDVATKHGVLWMNRDWTQRHNHWSREHRQRPVYMNKAQKNWDADKAAYEAWRHGGYPGSELAP